jgi:hypothetical protein
MMSAGFRCPILWHCFAGPGKRFAVNRKADAAAPRGARGRLEFKLVQSHGWS